MEWVAFVMMYLGLCLPFVITYFFDVKDQKLETSFFSTEVVYNNLNRTSLGWAYLHP
jgi:hypothetical protein